MCGRYTLLAAPELLQDLFGLAEAPDLAPRYNVAPTQQVAAVRRLAGGEGRELVLLRWGLIPSWASDPSVGNRLLNARAETVADKPSFRSALRSRRCLILADGFFEWQSLKGKKQPFYFRLRDGRPFAIAGLWERWARGSNGPVESCTLITTEANDLVRPLHERMPVILPPDAYEAWLDPAGGRPEQLQPLLRPYRAEEMIAYPVSVRVNSPRNDDAGCVEAVA
jgi:putative SOS response-associated peptidase YedK